NLVIDAHRQRKHRPRPLPDDGAGLCAPAQDLADLDRQFLDCWRDELLSRAWARLDAHEKETGQPFHTVLRFPADHPGVRSLEIAERLAGIVGKRLTAVWVRQNLRRAREAFVGLVRDEVAHSLGDPSAEEIDEEMRNLGLWAYCRQG